MLKVQKRELLEAINAGKTALHTVNEVLETLDNAEGWSTWDVMGGGLRVDLAKYEELDNAQEQMERSTGQQLKVIPLGDQQPFLLQLGKLHRHGGTLHAEKICQLLTVKGDVKGEGRLPDGFGR